MKVGAQPWWSDPLHSEATYALGAHAEGRSTWPNPTIFADRAEAERYLAFLESVSEDRKLAMRRGDVGGDEIMQWYAEYGARDDDTHPDGPREEQPDE